MRVLGIDPSLTNYGWAVIDLDSPARCLERGRFQTSARDLYIDRYVDLRAQLCELIRRLEIKKVGIEYPIFNASNSSQLYGLFLYSSEAFRSEKCDVVFFSPGQGKAIAAEFLKRPKGWKMDKSDMVEAARLDTNHKGSVRSFNHNEADAYWIGRAASRFWSLLQGTLKDSDLSKVEKHQFTRIHKYLKGKKKGVTVKTGLLYREDERFFKWSEE